MDKTLIGVDSVSHKRKVDITQSKSKNKLFQYPELHLLSLTNKDEPIIIDNIKVRIPVKTATDSGKYLPPNPVKVYHF